MPALGAPRVRLRVERQQGGRKSRGIVGDDDRAGVVQAETFGAESPFLSAAKRLLDTRDPAFRAVTAVKNQAVAYFKGSSLPYPEPGIRLVRQFVCYRLDQTYLVPGRRGLQLNQIHC